jgi:hypothetical protein
MRKIAMLVAAAFVLCGCDADVNIDTDYAKLSPGMLNSGARDVGSLFLIDTRDKTALWLETIDVSTYPTAKSQSSSSLDVGNLSGFSMSINAPDITPQITASVEAAVKGETRLTLTKFNVEEVRAPWQVIIDNILARKPADTEVSADPWRLSDATNSRRYIYLLVHGAIRAEKVSFTAGDKEDEGSGFTVKVKAAGRSIDAKVRFLNRNFFQWQGGGTAAILKYYAFRVTTAGGKYRIGRVNDPAELSAIFRKSQP